jgi:FkbM family methyltransferase
MQTTVGEMGNDGRLVALGASSYMISGDEGYLKHLGRRFEPDTFAILAALSDRDARVIDVGANIGITALAFSQLCPEGKVAAIEPVPRTFAYMRTNVARARLNNITTHNFALGNTEGEVVMQGNPHFLAGSFVVDKCRINDNFHFSDTVPLHKLDNAFPELGLDRIDLIKADVEGYELDVFEGAVDLLRAFKPIVYLEMNHWCLNMFRRMTLPEFRERLLAIFPHVYALQGSRYLDFRDDKEGYLISHEHLTKMQFMNLVAGYDRAELKQRLEQLSAKPSDDEHAAADVPGEPDRVEHDDPAALRHERDAIQERLDAMYASHSWRLTKPLRMLADALRRR